jgi:hypothetical protein
MPILRSSVKPHPHYTAFVAFNQLNATRETIAG